MFSCSLCVRPGPRHRVDLHVVPEVARGGEGARTLLAGMRLVLDVGHAVVVQVGGGREALPAHLAHVWLLPGVDPPVRVQAGAGAEPLVANVAHMWPLPGVGADVSLQEAGTVELLATRVAGQHGLGPPRDWQRLELVVAAVHQLGLGLGHVLTTTHGML